jgi:PKD repeat protein
MKLKNIFLIYLAFFVITISTASATSVEYLNNSKHLAVYLENTQGVAHDPFCTSMFYEYNLIYLFNDTISSQNLSNIQLLLIPEDRMSNSTATIVNNYLNNGGKIWFLNDPVFDENGNLQTANRINIFGVLRQYPVSPSQPIYFDNSDPLFSNFPASIPSQSSIESFTWMRAYRFHSGTISGFTYDVLMHQGDWDGNMLVKFENTTTGAKAVYSNPNMFISGGKTNYFDAYIATKLFYSLKNWILDFGSNTYSVSITYPRSDKIFSLTVDDVQASNADINSTTKYFTMKNNLGYSMPDTFFIVPSSDTTKAGLDYFSQYGDTHTIHPHGVDWSRVNSATVYNVTMYENITNLAEGTLNYGFYSFRFPGTYANIQAFKIFASRGYLISSNYGPDTGMGPIGNLLGNTLFFPKQKTLFGKKTNLIEIETASRYDIDGTTPVQIYNDNIATLQYFRNINFPANYILGGHFQGFMTNTSMLSNVTHVLTYVTQDLNDVSFESLETIAKYNVGIKTSTIKAYKNNNKTSIEIATPQLINNFTIKMTNTTNMISADYDGTDIHDNGIIYKNGICYVYHNVDSGIHTINLIDSGIPIESFSMSSDSGVAPLTVAFNDASVIKSNHWYWDFDNDGKIDSTQKSPVHVFKEIGIYAINMTVHNPNGNFSCVKTIKVNPFTINILNNLYWRLHSLERYNMGSTFTEKHSVKGRFRTFQNPYYFQYSIRNRRNL